MPQSQKFQISIVNYANTLPFKWALKQSALIEEIDLQEDIPSICAQKLKFKRVDLALVPVALIPELDHYFIESEYCIGANGRVESVKLYSKVPIENISEVALDYQSRSSVNLTKVLFKFFWKKEVLFTDTLPGYEDQIGGTKAAVVIGDRTFALNGTNEFEYDLSEEWQKFTGLPFVFAAWLSTEKIPESFMKEFNRVLRDGVEHIEQVIEEEELPVNISKLHMKNYLLNNIDYNLDAEKLKALKLFLEYMKQLEVK